MMRFFVPRIWNVSLVSVLFFVWFVPFIDKGIEYVSIEGLLLLGCSGVIVLLLMNLLMLLVVFGLVYRLGVRNFVITPKFSIVSFRSMTDRSLFYMVGIGESRNHTVCVANGNLLYNSSLLKV